MKTELKLMTAALAAFLLAGCVAFPAAKYDYTEYAQDGTGMKTREFHVQSRRDIEQLGATYGDFQISVGKATAQPSPMEAAAASAIPNLLNMLGAAVGIFNVPGMGLSPPAQPGQSGYVQPPGPAPYVRTTWPRPVQGPPK